MTAGFDIRFMYITVRISDNRIILQQLGRYKAVELFVSGRQVVSRRSMGYEDFMLEYGVQTALSWNTLWATRTSYSYYILSEDDLFRCFFLVRLQTCLLEISEKNKIFSWLWLFNRRRATNGSVTYCTVVCKIFWWQCKLKGTETTFSLINVIKVA